jgi:hypothetical protein
VDAFEHSIRVTTPIEQRRLIVIHRIVSPKGSRFRPWSMAAKRVFYCCFFLGVGASAPSVW